MIRRLLAAIALLLAPAFASAQDDIFFDCTIPAATVQAATTGHAYWVGPPNAAGNCALVDAGTNIAAANPTNQPPIAIDVSRFQEMSWSVFYGAQTGNVGGKLAVAELWPESPVGVVGTIPPYVRDVASHWLVTGGLGFVVQDAIPEPTMTLLDLTSLTNTALVPGPLDARDFASLKINSLATAATAITVGEVDAAGASGVQVIGTSAAGSWNYIGWGVGAWLSTAAPMQNSMNGPVSPRMTASAAAVAASTTRLVIIGERKRPLRRPGRIAPYIQWVNPGTGGAAPVVPTAASPIYVLMRGR